MGKKKMLKYLVFIAIALFLAVNIIWILHDINGDPSKNQRAQKQLTAYLKTNYPDYETQFDIGKPVYNFKEKSYTMQCVYRSQPRIYFEVEQEYDGRIYDTYEEGFVKAISAWDTYAMEQYQKIQTETWETCEQEFEYCDSIIYEDEIDEKTKHDFYHNKHMDTLNALSVTTRKQMDEESIDEMVASFRRLKEIFQDSDVPIKSYSILFDYEEGRKGYDVENVGEALIDQPAFPEMLRNALCQHDRYKNEYGFYIKDM